MVTIVTMLDLKPGAEGDWDAAMRERFAAARTRPGWGGGQLLKPLDRPRRRLIVGSWRSRADWEAWHHDPAFAETRARLAGLEAAPPDEWWHEVVAAAEGPVPVATEGLVDRD